MTDYELIVFDWDGTLVDSAADIVAGMQQASDALGLPRPDENRMRRAIGLGLADAFGSIFPDVDGDELLELMRRYAEHHKRLPGKVFGRPFAGVEPVLSGLGQAGYQLAVATGKSRAGLDRSLASVPWSERFVATRCADESASKPDPKMLEQLSLELCIEPASILMVGDTTYDMEMARRFGCAAVGVAWGVHEPEELLEHEALVVLEGVHDLPAWLGLN